MKINIRKHVAIIALGTLFVGCVSPKSFNLKIAADGKDVFACQLSLAG